MPLILLLPFALVACIWAFVLYRKAGLIGGCLVTILAGSVFGYDFFHASVITVDRVVMAAVVVGYFVCRNIQGLPARAFSRVDVVAIVFLVCLLGSTLAHDWRFEGSQPLATYLFFYAMPFALYWVASRCEVTEQGQRYVIGLFALFGAYLSLTGICEVLELSALVFPRYIMNPEVVEFLGRARGPFLNPIANGLYLTAAILATLMWIPYVSKSHRAAVVGLAGLLCLGALCTLTRSIWLGVGMSIVGLGVMLVPREHRFRVVFAAALCGGLFLAASGSSLLSFKRDKHLTAKETEDSAKLRPILAAYAFEMFRDNPITGVGMGQYRRRNIEYVTSRSFDLPMEKGKSYIQHNVFLSLLVETGIVGVAFFSLLLFVWAVDGWTLWNASSLPLWKRQMGLFSLLLLTAYIPNAMFHEMSVIPMVNMLMFFAAGLCRNMRSSATERANSRIGNRRLSAAPA